MNDNTAEVRPIETADLRFGASINLTALGSGQAISAVGPGGLTVLNPVEQQATALPLSDQPFNFSVDGQVDVQAGTSDHISIAPDGAIWTIDGSALRRQTSTTATRSDLGLEPDARLSLVGNEPFVVDPANRRARLGDGDWQTLDGTIDPSEFVIQRPGPSAECGWIGANDELWCVAGDGIDERATVDGPRHRRQ